MLSSNKDQEYPPNEAITKLFLLFIMIYSSEERENHISLLSNFKNFERIFKASLRNWEGSLIGERKEKLISDFKELMHYFLDFIKEGSKNLKYETIMRKIE